MGNFWTIVNKVIKEADVLLMLLDARLVQETRNAKIEEKIRDLKKPLIYVITKADLVEDKDEVEKFKKHLRPCVFVSSTKHYGTTLLRNRIMIVSERNKILHRPIQVGVIGYPNVGKSSLINAMSGKSAAPTSSMSGYTTGVQKVRGDNMIMFLDTPGVIPHNEKDIGKQSMIGSIDHTKIKEPDLSVMRLMAEFPGKIEKHYDVPVSDDFEETIEIIAIKKSAFKQGREPNIDKMSRTILRDWQIGLIK